MIQTINQLNHSFETISHKTIHQLQNNIETTIKKNPYNNNLHNINKKKCFAPPPQQQLTIPNIQKISQLDSINNEMKPSLTH